MKIDIVDIVDVSKAQKDQYLVDKNENTLIKNTRNDFKKVVTIVNRVKRTYKTI